MKNYRRRAIKAFDDQRPVNLSTLVLIGLLSSIGSPAAASDAHSSLPSEWPQWRGTDRDGIWSDSDVLTEFPARPLPPDWRARIGPGYSGPAVAGGRVFVTDRLAERQVERVLAFDQKSGRLLWKHEYPANYAGLDYASGPRATPTVAEDRVYIKGAMGHLCCLQVDNGQVIWSYDLVEAFNARLPKWGMVGAPLIDGDVILVNVGGSPNAGIIAFHKRTGAVKWRALDDRPGYAPPSIVVVGDRRQLIFWSAEAINSLDPETGAPYWRVPFKDRADMTICSPVLHQGHLYVSSYYGGSLLLKLASQRPAATVVWRDRRGKAATLAACISTPLLKGDHIYGVDRSGAFRCLEISTGQVVWETNQVTGGKVHGNAHITPNADREFLFNESGELIIAQLSPGGYRELSRTQLIPATVGVKDHRAVDWSHPAYANRHIFVRNDEELRSISLAREPQ